MIFPFLKVYFEYVFYPIHHSDISTALPTEYVVEIKRACLICLVVSHSEGKRLRQVAGGQLGGIIIWRSTARRTVVGNWDLGKRIYSP